MRHLLLAACLTAFALTSAGTLSAQEPVKKAAPASKAKKGSAKTTTSSVPAGAEKWQCELGNVIYLSGDLKRDQVIGLRFQGKAYRLPRMSTVTGADRYYDQRSGMDLVVIPDKAMLFNRKGGHRLADECQTAAMQAGAAAPTQSGALRSPVGGLLTPSTPDAASH